MLTFSERTIRVSIDAGACLGCSSKACAAACETYSRGMLRLQHEAPSVAHLDEDAVRHDGTECLACEYACRTLGNGALSIDVPVEGLDAYVTASLHAAAKGSGS